MVDVAEKPRDEAELARYLLPFLIAPVHRVSTDDELDDAEPDIEGALSLELRYITAQDTELAQCLEDKSEGGDKKAVARLCLLLGNADAHSRELIHALVVGHATQLPTAKRASPRWLGRVARLLHIKRVRRSGWVRRQAAGLCMNLLIFIVAFVTWLVAWSPATSPRPLGTTALMLFALWCLSFLPGWLYVRFLGKRAGTLWDEFVLNLHRLGYDLPKYLPRPPVTSDFYREWVADDGPLFTYRQNVYRQKFNAYYGQSVSKPRTGAEAAAKIESLFPVFLLTTVLAVAWTAVLWDPSFISTPTGRWDALKFGFLGAYLFIMQTLIRRFFQADLRPSAYAGAVARIIIVLVLVAVVEQLSAVEQPPLLMVVAFVVGFFPLIGLQALQRVAATTLRTIIPSLNPDYPLNELDGLNIWYESRLLEEGIEDMQNLVTADLVEVILHTRVPVGRLVDWIDQAHLYLHLDRTERTSRERRKAKNASSPAGQSERAEMPEQSGKPDRRTLRRIGVRTATDLRKAFPTDPPLAQPKTEDDRRWQQISLLLSKEESLRPIWSWQERTPMRRRGGRGVTDLAREVLAQPGPNGGRYWA